MLQPTCRLCATLCASTASSSRASLLSRRVSSIAYSGTRMLSTRPPGRTASSSTNSPSPPSRLRMGATAALCAVIGGAILLRPERERLSPHHFTPLKVLSVEPLTPETSLFRLALPKALLDPAHPPSPTAIKSLFVMQPDLQIQRAYTPLSAASFDRDGPAEISLVVKRYADGEASRYIHRLRTGDELRVRGPVTTWEYGQVPYDEVVFIVGGTGITPALQYIESTLGGSPSSAPSPSISVIYASPSPSRILLKPELDSLVARNPSKLSVHYLVDTLDAGMQKSSAQAASVGRLQVRSLRNWIGDGRNQSKRMVIVVCGPEQMVNAVAGPRARDLSQGPVAGMLGQLGYSQEEVIKL